MIHVLSQYMTPGHARFLRDQMLSITIYGVYYSKMMFFESPSAREIPDEPHSSYTGIVKVTKCEVSEAQIIKGFLSLY